MYVGLESLPFMVLESLSLDSSPALSRLIQVSNPLRSLQTLALEADLSLFKLVRHLVYWVKVTIIYPLCETNVYIFSSHADTRATSLLIEDFVRQFPGRSLPVELAEFSFPTQLGENTEYTFTAGKTGFESTDGFVDVTAPPPGAATHMFSLCLQCHGARRKSRRSGGPAE